MKSEKARRPGHNFSAEVGHVVNRGYPSGSIIAGPKFWEEFNKLMEEYVKSNCHLIEETPTGKKRRESFIKKSYDKKPHTP